MENGTTVLEHFSSCQRLSLLHKDDDPARKTTFEELFGWYDKAAVCKAAVSGYYKRTDDETINELLDAVCYENYLITAELEQTLGKHEALSDEKKYKANMYSVKLKKADQGEVQDYPEILFPVRQVCIQNAPPPQPSAVLQLQTGLPPLPPAAAAVLQQIRLQMLQNFYSYTFSLTNAPAPQPALPQTPHRAAAALQQPIRLQLAQDYHRLSLELMNIRAPTHQPQIPPAFNRVHLQQNVNSNQLALSDALLPQRPTSAKVATPPPSTPPVAPQRGQGPDIFLFCKTNCFHFYSINRFFFVLFISK
ncbi:hypothetical protein CAEBREN_20948 [Caenorhabditis brenneri]|uniref:Uncharacterized protein n=1 Tax=Caenorhabditis brenneri TaxID=135651 RepID=G0N289_CAEBE|nr:hypothetical protein CAEBREN_20948 [Caenorhabditis brenneri]